MAISTHFLTGFEYGTIAPGSIVNGAGLLDSITSATAGPQAVGQRNGSYYFLAFPGLNAAGHGTKNVPASQNKFITRVAIKGFTLPSSATEILRLTGTSVNVIFRCASDGTLDVQVGAGTVRTGTALLTTSAWIVLELQWDLSVNPNTLDWKLDGVPQTQATGGTVDTATMTSMSLGRVAASGAAFSMLYDDWIFGSWTAAATDWYGDGAVLGLPAGSDGTHNAGTTIFINSDTATTPNFTNSTTNANSFLDELPWSATRSTTDNVSQEVANAANYLEIKPAAASAIQPKANAVRALLSYSSPATQANLAACEVRNSAAVITELWGLINGVGQDYSETANQFKGAIVPAPAAGWTKAEIDSIVWRIGGCTLSDVSPRPTWQALMLEVDYPIPLMPELNMPVRIAA